MSIALLVVTDGRDDYLAHCIASANVHLRGPITERWIYDDTGDAAYRGRLVERYPNLHHINGGPRQGFGGAIQHAWTRLAEHSAADWVFHLEQDFLFTRDVDLTDLVDVLDEHPHLAQMALQRQAWNAQEHAAGGVVARHPEAFTPAHDGRGRTWLEHRLFFTTNPTLYRMSLCRLGWPNGEHSEGVFSLQLLESGSPEALAPAVRFGYWGGLTDDPWVEHIGHKRVGHGY